MPHQTRITVFALSVSTAAILITTYLLSLSLVPHGPKTVLNDSIIYMRTAFHLWRGEGFTMVRYEPVADTVLRFPLIHYPPLVSMLYALGLSSGLSLATVPSVITLICWVLFLAGIGVLAARLGRTPMAGAAAVLVASLTYAFWMAFQQVMSEPVFLPLLVWLMVVLMDLPVTSKVDGRVCLLRSCC